MWGVIEVRGRVGGWGWVGREVPEDDEAEEDPADHDLGAGLHPEISHLPALISTVPFLLDMQKGDEGESSFPKIMNGLNVCVV
jgi:hypothetical protein